MAKSGKAEPDIHQSIHLPVKGEEKFLGAVAHLALFFLPVLVPLAIYLLERNKADFSEFILFQAKQAVLYQILALVAFGEIGLLLWLGSRWLVGDFFTPAFFGLLLLALGYALFAAWQCMQGRDFHYFWLGDLIRELRL